VQKLADTFTFFLFIGLLTSCGNEDKKVLYSSTDSEDKIKFIEYSKDKHNLQFINAQINEGSVSYHYNIRLLESGEIMNVVKHDSKYYQIDSVNIEAERRLQLLVSDTVARNPNLFGHPVNGFYDTFVVNNVITQRDPKCQILPLTTEERRLFSISSTLANKPGIKFKAIDSFKLIGWFKYIF